MRARFRWGCLQANARPWNCRRGKYLLAYVFSDECLTRPVELAPAQRGQAAIR
jgi:hypothetical protein